MFLKLTTFKKNLHLLTRAPVLHRLNFCNKCPKSCFSKHTYFLKLIRVNPAKTHVPHNANMRDKNHERPFQESCYPPMRQLWI